MNVLLSRRLSIAILLLFPLVSGFSECVSAQTAASKDPVLTLLEGQSITAKALEIASGKIKGEGLPADLALDDLSNINWPTQAVAGAETPRVIVELRGAGRLRAREATIADERCHVATCFGPRISVPLDAVRAIRFDPAAANPDFDKAIAAPAADEDRIFVRVEGKLEGVTGLIQSLSDKEIVLDASGQERKLARDKLFGVVIAQAQSADEPPACTLAFSDGSLLAGELLTLARGQVEFQLPGGGKLVMPSFPVTRLNVRSNRVAYFSDLKPVTDEQTALVTQPRPWQRDKSVLGRPLTLGTRVFEKGIGVHARSELTFATGGKFDALAATIGIDAETGGKGDCIFTVLGDGQPLLTRRMRGNEPGQEIQVDLAGAQQVTLLVEAGEDLDLADHADWCDVRLVKHK